MLKFCSCGSLIMDDVCTNKNCSFSKSTAAKTTKAKNSKAAKGKSVKSADKVASDSVKARRSSKCITYSLDELNKSEND